MKRNRLSPNVLDIEVLCIIRCTQIRQNVNILAETGINYVYQHYVCLSFLVIANMRYAPQGARNTLGTVSSDLRYIVLQYCIKGRVPTG